MQKSFYDIEDKNRDYQEVSNLVLRINQGLKAMAMIYHDHSDDIESFQRIHELKNNVGYRLKAAEHHYFLLLNEYFEKESELSMVLKDDPNLFDKNFIGRNPVTQKIEEELAAIFDSLVYHLNSTFDYLAHITSYICMKKLNNTVGWIKLKKFAFAKGNELSTLWIKEKIAKVNNEFVASLYDYRSRLIHTKRDIHPILAFKSNGNDVSQLYLSASDFAQKSFKKSLKKFNEDKGISLSFLASTLIRDTLSNIEILLDALVYEILVASKFPNNWDESKKGLILMHRDPNTNTAKLMSDLEWDKFKGKIDS